MTNTALQIANLMTNNGKTAADMTHAVKILGNGSMQRSFSRIGDFFSSEITVSSARGLRIGRIQGGIAGVLGVAVTYGFIWLLSQDKEIKALSIHEKEGRKILQTMESTQAPTTDNDKEELSNQEAPVIGKAVVES